MADETPRTRVWLSLAAISDAVHHLNQQPLEKLDRALVDQLTTYIYLAAGLTSEEANLLYGESVDRHADRLKAVIVEVQS